MVSQDSMTTQAQLGMAAKEKQWLGDKEAHNFMIQRLKDDDHMGGIIMPGMITQTLRWCQQWYVADDADAVPFLRAITALLGYRPDSFI